VSALTLPVQPNPFKAHTMKALRDVGLEALPPPKVALERPQNYQSNLKPEESREHVLHSPDEEGAAIRACWSCWSPL